MKLQRGPIALYYQIAQILRSQIHSQEYKANDMLPTEDEMMRTFGVSRTTVRQAFQLLHNQGLIRRIAGKGTFVQPESHARHTDWSVQSIEGLIHAGSVTGRRLLGTKTIRAGEGLARSLRIPPGSGVTQYRKVEFVDEEPFFHATIHVPHELAAKIPVERVKKDPIFTLIEERCRLRIQEVRQWVTASLASSDIARHLKVKPGDPVLLVERHFIDDTGRVVEIATDHYRTDKMRHYLQLNGRDSLGPPYAAHTPPHSWAKSPSLRPPDEGNRGGGGRRSGDRDDENAGPRENHPGRVSPHDRGREH